MEKFLRLRDVIAATGLSRSGLYELMDAGHFPPSVKLSSRAVAWRESEIEDWQRRRIAERNREAA